jgi:hypothetical protein
MIEQNEINVLLVANVHGGNLHHPDTEAIKGRCIRTNLHLYILKCIKCSVDLATAVEERNISQLDIKLQERSLICFKNVQRAQRISILSLFKSHTSFASILSNEKVLQFSLIMDIKASLSRV